MHVVRIVASATSLALVAACSSAGEAPEAGASASSPMTVDAQIRSDLKRALSVGARCRVGDETCRSAILEAVTKNERSDAVVAGILERVDALDRADFCAELSRDDGALFAVGSDSVASTNEASVVFDLTSFQAAVITAADGLSDLVDGAPYEAFSRAAPTFPPTWVTGAKAAGPELFVGDDGLRGAVRPSRSPREAREALQSIVSVDGSTFREAPKASRTSALRLARMLGAKERGDVVVFERSSTLGAGAAIASAVVQVAGLEGLGPRAATIAIARDRLSSFPGGVLAYCGRPAGTLATRSYTDGDASLDDFGGVQDRTASTTTEENALDCSSGLDELSCAEVFPGQALVCAQNGPGKGSCCRKPITEGLSRYKTCTTGPDSGCPAGTYCQRAAESGPTASTYICVGADACAAFEGAPEPRPADFVRKAKGRIADCFTHNWANESFRYAENPKYLPDANWAYWLGATAAELIGWLGDNLGYLVLQGSDGDKLLNDTIERLKQLAEQQGLVPYQKTLAAQCVSSNLFAYSFDNLSKLFGSSAAAEREAGVCTEFAAIAVRLLNATGIWAKRTFSVAEEHAFVEVYYPQVDKASYYIEPQHNPAGNQGVKFYNKH